MTRVSVIAAGVAVFANPWSSCIVSDTENSPGCPSFPDWRALGNQIQELLALAANTKGLQPGDIVIQKTHASGDVYILSVFERASQLVFHAYDEAVRHASAGARKDRVDAWYTEDGQTYRPVAQYRTQ